MLAPRKKLWSTPRSAVDVASDLLGIGAGGGRSTATRRTASLTPGDVVYDVGCGDGSVLLRLAELHPRCGGRFVGIEIDPDRADEARRNVSEARRRGLAVGGGEDGDGGAPEVEIICKNALEVDYGDATVVFLYLVPRGLRLVKPLLLRHCHGLGGDGNGDGGGAGVEEGEGGGEKGDDADLLRVVTYMSPLEGEVPVATGRCVVDHQPGAEWPLYLYHFRRRRLR